MHKFSSRGVGVPPKFENRLQGVLQGATWAGNEAEVGSLGGAWLFGRFWCLFGELSGVGFRHRNVKEYLFCSFAGVDTFISPPVVSSRRGSFQGCFWEAQNRVC